MSDNCIYAWMFIANPTKTIVIPFRPCMDLGNHVRHNPNVPREVTIAFCRCWLSALHGVKFSGSRMSRTRDIRYIDIDRVTWSFVITSMCHRHVQIPRVCKLSAPAAAAAATRLYRMMQCKIRRNDTSQSPLTL